MTKTLLTIREESGMNGNFLLDTNAIINILKAGRNIVKPGDFFKLVNKDFKTC